MRRAQVIGKGLGAIGFILLWTAIPMATGKYSAAIALWFWGCIIVSSVACGARQFPVREIPFSAWAGMALGLVLIGLGYGWVFIYESPAAVSLTMGMLVAALATMAVGLWVYQRGADR